MFKKGKSLVMVALVALASLMVLLTFTRCDRDRQGAGPGPSASTQGRDRTPGEPLVRVSQEVGRGESVSASAAYAAHCGACHGAYPPMLLPAASWEKILTRLDDHFGEKVPLEPPVKDSVSQYLLENGADRSSAKKAAKIVASLNGQIPLRVTEVPYIQKKHRKISPEVFQRKAVGGLANCQACHRSAAQGHFSDRDVAIPQ
jgi:hypothetical protein